MRVCYIGNFVPDHSTENSIRRAFQYLGWEVDRVQEQDYLRLLERRQGRTMLDRMMDADLVLHTMTQGTLPNRNVARFLWQRCAAEGIPTASVHLDLFYGLSSRKSAGPQRSRLPATHPMFKVAWVFTADGGHDAEFAKDGVNHHWLPPGVDHTEAIDVDPHADWNYDPLGPLDMRRLEAGHYLVGFAGSDRYHREWPHRQELLAWLRETYGDRFLHIGGSSTPRITGLALNRVLASVPVWVGDSCLTRPDNRYWSDRVPETWGRGGFLIHPHVEALDEHYGHTHPGAAWECGDWQALQSEVTYWLSERSGREARRQGFAVLTRDHDTYVQRVRTILATIGLPVRTAL